MVVRIVNAASLLVVATVIVLGVWVFWNRGDSGSRYNTERDRLPAEFLKAMRTGHRMGPAGAPVGILLYTVYECSFCREFEAVLQQARRRYPDHLAVTVKLFTSFQDEHIDLYLAAECAAGQGVFEPFHAAAMRIESPVGGVAGWERVMDSVPIPDPFTFRQCVENAMFAERIEATRAGGLRLVCQSISHILRQRHDTACRIAQSGRAGLDPGCGAALSSRAAIER